MERECECLKRNVELLKRSVTCVWAATPAARQLSSVAADGLIRSTLLKGLGSCSSRAETSCKDVTTSPQAEEAPRARAAPPPVHAPRNNPRDTPIRTQAPKAWPDPKTGGRAPPKPTKRTKTKLSAFPEKQKLHRST